MLPIIWTFIPFSQISCEVGESMFKWFKQYSAKEKVLKIH